MGFIDRLKNYINNSDEDPIDPGIGGGGIEGIDDPPIEPEVEPMRQFDSFTPPPRPTSSPSNVVDLRSASRTPVVLKKIDTYQAVQSVADELKAKRIVILNLETCPNDVTKRILDFLSGVAYTNSGNIKKIAGRAYIITPDSVTLSGEILEEIASGNMDSEYYSK